MVYYIQKNQNFDYSNLLIQSKYMNNKKLFLKILFVGECGVGKSSLIFRYTDQKFNEDLEFQTIGVEFIEKVIDINKESVKICIWDTSGDKKYHKIILQCYAKSDAIYVVFDLSKRDSFIKTIEWIDSIRQKLGQNIKIFLIGNKCDLEREVTKEEAIEFASNQKIKYFETSVKDCICVEEIFSYLFNEIYCPENSGNFYNNDSTQKEDNSEKKDAKECIIE